MNGPESGTHAMSMVFILLPLALLVAGGMLVVFIWAARSGQFDDLETPARRMLHDDDPLVRPRPSRARGGSSEEGS
jgi:cbb3-type cytochrome oxidase maturation protein